MSAGRLPPTPASPAVRRRMQATPQRNTRPELALRRELHHLGLRYRIHRRPVAHLRREADVVFVRARVAVFIDSCFWHGCPEHASWPAENAAWWRAKIAATRERDRDTNVRLRKEGWTVVRVWEHDDPRHAAREISVLVRQSLYRA